MESITSNERRILFEWLKYGKAKRISYRIKVFHNVNGHSKMAFETRQSAYSLRDALNGLNKSRLPFMYKAIIIYAL